jgi:hypothetical protein
MVERLSRGPASVSALARPLRMSLPGRRASWERRLDRLGDYLAEGDDHVDERRKT